MRTTLRWIVVIGLGLVLCFVFGNLIEDYETWERIFSIMGAAVAVFLSAYLLIWLFWEQTNE